MELEPNNNISEAINSNINLTGETNQIITGSIDSLFDVDIYEFQLNSGDGITLNIDTVGGDSNDNAMNFDSYLRVFDSEGNQLAFNDDFSPETEAFSTDSFLGFIANETAKYYVGVSSVANTIYDPVTGENPDLLRDDFVAGEYNLSLDLVEVIPDEDSDSTIVEASAIDTENKKSHFIDGEIEIESDVDIFKIQLGEGEGVKLKVNARTIDSQLDSYLRIFDASGNEIAFDDNSLNNPPENPGDVTTDSTIDFVPPTPGEYYVGVSSAGNFDYDPVNGNTNLNFSNNTGISTGNYQLQVDVLEILPDEDPDNTISEAIATGVSSSGERKTTLSGRIDPELDADLYRVQLDAGDGLYLDIDAAAIDSDLNSFLRIFDASGNEIAFDNNDDANFTGDPSVDAAIAFAPDAAGEYFIGVSNASNIDYDPVNGRTNFSSNVTSPFSTLGDYDLKINILNVIADADSDNTIAEAIDSGVSSSGETSNRLTAAIDSPGDIDFYRFQLNEGEGVTLNIDASSQESDLDSYLRLFDESGNELAFDDDDDNNIDGEDTTTDSLLNFVADTSGEYFVGVSSEGNTAYDAVNGSNNFSQDRGFSTGDYQLAIDISAVTADEDPDNTISEAIDTGINPNGENAITFNDAIASNSDVDIYKFQLSAGDTVSLDIDAAIQDSELDSVLRLFDSLGNEITNNDDGTAADETSSLDSFIEFTAETDGEYYLGVSSFANFEYDPLNGNTNFSNNIGTSAGEYDLTISLDNVV